jgi:hypothetical protein
LQFYDRLTDAIFDALEKHEDVENSVWEKAIQLLRKIETQYANLLGEIQEHHEWLYK